MSLSKKLLDAGFPAPSPNSKVAAALRRVAVEGGPEFSRIVSLPRRKINIEKDGTTTVERDGKTEKVPDLTPVFARPGGTMKLRPLQNLSLWEAYNNNGAFLMLGIGEGKTLTSLLLPEAMNSKRAVLLVKPELKAQLIKRDIPFYRKHFNLPLARIYVIAYSELSSPRTTEILERVGADLVIADEAHKLRIKSSARTRRFLRFFKKFPETRFVALSGTFSRRSIVDYAHLIELSLKKNSPLPNNFKDLEAWSEAIDVAEDPRPPGVLDQFCTAEENVRQGFRRRLVETPGVIASTESSVDVSLLIFERKIEVPNEIKIALQKLYASWETPNGEEELADAMALNKVARQLACGFYYKWVWPNGIRDEEWVQMRRRWHREVRNRLLHTSISGMDSPLLLFNAARDGRWQSEHWGNWNAVKHRPEPPTTAVWLNWFLVKDAIYWGKELEKKKEGGIIFVENTAVGEKIALGGDWVYMGADSDASALDRNKYPVFVASIKANSEGKNLQAWSKALIVSPQSSGATAQQLIGRLHRQGQQDDVEIYTYFHTQEFINAFKKSLDDARFLEQTTGDPQKLLAAQIVAESLEGELDKEGNEVIVPAT